MKGLHILWQEMIEFLDSFGIPWLCIYGNHDNESQMGVNWQIDAIRNSKFGYIKDGDLENGNSNYTVGIKQGEELKYVFYMLDTNGCREAPDNLGEAMLPNNPDIDEIQQTVGIYEDQLEWIEERSNRLDAHYGDDIPSMMFMHVPPIEAVNALAERYPSTYNELPFYATLDGDMGMALEAPSGFSTDGALFKTAKAVNCVGMFVGHQHEVALSTVYEGVRLTYGLKLGASCYHNPEMLGSTKITIDSKSNSYKVEYVFSELEYSFDD